MSLVHRTFLNFSQSSFVAPLNSCNTCERDARHSSFSASLSAGDLDKIYVSVDCVLLRHFLTLVNLMPHSFYHVLISALPAMCISVVSLFTSILRHGYMP